MIRAWAPRATDPFPPQTQNLEYPLERNRMTTFVVEEPAGAFNCRSAIPLAGRVGGGGSEPTVAQERT